MTASGHPPRRGQAGCSSSVRATARGDAQLQAKGHELLWNTWQHMRPQAVSAWILKATSWATGRAWLQAYTLLWRQQQHRHVRLQADGGWDLGSAYGCGRQLTHVFASSPQEADNIWVSVTYGVRTPTSGRTRFQGESASIADWQANTTDAGQVLASRLFGSQAPVDCCGGGEIMLQAWLD